MNYHSLKPFSVVVGDKYNNRFRTLSKAVEVTEKENGKLVRFNHSSYHFYEWPNSKLANCEVCGKLTGKRFLRYAWINKPSYNDKDDDDSIDYEACIGCWKKVDRINSKVNDYIECRKLIGRIEREIANVLKNKNYW